MHLKHGYELSPNESLIGRTNFEKSPQGKNIQTGAKGLYEKKKKERNDDQSHSPVD